MNPDYALAGKAVMVTGAGRGIGHAVARAFAAQGCRLLAVDRDAAALQSAKPDFSAATDVATIACDLGHDADLDQLHAATLAFSDRLDVLVNNAGTEYPTPIDDTGSAAQAHWSRLLDNNVGGMARAVRTLLPLLGSGSSIINQASIWGLTGVSGFSAYVASKHAVIGLTRSLAWELAPRGIRVNAVCPGWIRTESAMRSLAAMAVNQDRSEDEVLQDILSAQAIPALLEPKDITGIYLFLASNDARPLTGQAIVISNGEVIH
ncbi:MAG: SDR family oxidoreductase [Prolixibacteraceae bacterium]|nr:SDR family oxidoreductase [Burkholderiales bacterium]